MRILLHCFVDLLYRWSLRWRLNFNIKKCNCVNITRKKYPANHVYSLGGKSLGKTDCQQDLGLLISSNAKFSKHGSKVINKANSMLGLLKRNCSSKHFSVRTRRLLYLALVKTHLDYASEAWSGQSLNITSAIERVQRRATNYILGISSRSVPYKDIAKSVCHGQISYHSHSGMRSKTYYSYMDV